MLEKPDFQDEKIVACVQDEYGLRIAQIAFLPLGADLNTAVYRAWTGDGTSYFVKLRRGAFDDISVALPKFLGDYGVGHLIPPLATRTGQLWSDLDAYKLIVYPYVEGRNGYETALNDRHWRDLGAALKGLHTASLPVDLRRRIQQETYTPHWRDNLKAFMGRIGDDAYPDAIARELASFLQARREVVLDLVGRAERLARSLQACSPEFVVCHADLHAGNLLIDTSGALYIVDWDTAVLACKERDLMFAGGGLGGGWRTAQEEEVPFYQGYGPVQVDRAALAYYRYERIVQDVAIYCEQLLLSGAGGADREQSLRYCKSIFLPGGTIELAYRSET